MQQTTLFKLWNTRFFVILIFFISTATFAQMQWGVNVHDGSTEPEILGESLLERNITRVRMDLWGMDPVYLEKFLNAATTFYDQGIDVEAIIYTVFSNGQPRSQDVDADLVEVEETAYNMTRPQVENTMDVVFDFELQNEVSLYPNIKASGSTGQKASDYDVPCGRLQAAVLRGMSHAIDDLRNETGLPLRIILGTTDRSFGFLAYMQEQGVLFDIVGYHIYPWEQHPSLASDPWFGSGGPLGQLAKFNKPIHINEFNAGEIYSGVGGYASLPQYENQPGQPVTEKSFKGLNKHIKEILNQTKADVRTIVFYEAWDETHKEAPENRFGLFYDAPYFKEPKLTLLLISCFAVGYLSDAEMDSLTTRGLGPCGATSVEECLRDAQPGQNEGAAIPRTFALYQNFPNPFNPQTVVRFDVATAGNVMLDVFDINGHKVRTLANEMKNAGSFNIVWDACNDQGIPVANGLYFYRLIAGDFSAVGKMTFLK